jgi:hypothetical protein
MTRSFSRWTPLAMGLAWLGAFIFGPMAASAQESFAEFQRRQRDAASSGSGLVVTATAKSAKSSQDQASGSVALGDVKPSLAGVVDSYALSVATMRERARARLNPGLEQVLVPEDFEAALKQAEQDVLYEWAEIKILALEAQNRGFSAAPAEVEKRLEQIAIAAERPGEIETVLGGFGIRLEDYRVELSDAILAEKLVLDRVDNLYSRADLKAVYERNLASFYRPRRVRARAVIQDLNRAKDDSEFNYLFREMDKAYSALRSGVPFAEVARRHSGAPISRERGGDLGWLTPGNQLPAPFNVKIFNFPVNTPTKVLRSDDQQFLYIFQVIEKRPEETLPFAEVMDDVKLLVYDEVKKVVYEEARRQHKVFLNPSGIPERYFERFNLATLQIL